MHYPIEQVIEAMVDLVLVVDPTGCIPLANAAAVEITGYTANELAALSIAKLLTDEQSGLRTPVRRRVEAGESLQRSDAWLTTKKGVRIPVSVTAAPISTQAVANAIVLVVRDARETRALLAERDAEIARREEAERSLRRAITSIESRLDQTRAQVQLSERRTSVATLAAGVGGDLRGIVTRQRECLEALEEMELTVDARSALAELNDIAADLEARARRLIQLAIPDDAVNPPRVIDLHRALREIIQMMQAAGTLGGHDVQLLVHDTRTLVTVHRARLEQIMFNVLVNAAEAMTATMTTSGKIIVAVHAADTPERVLVEISDNGPGIPSEIAPRVWEPFFSTKPSDQHAGMGLAVVRKAVRSYGGNATMKSTRGIGASVTFDLPRAPEQS